MRQSRYFCEWCRKYFEVLRDKFVDVNYCPSCGKDVIKYIGGKDIEDEI